MKKFKGKIYKYIYTTDSGWGVVLFNLLDNPKKVLKLVGNVSNLNKDYIYEIEVEQFEDKLRNEINFKLINFKNIKDFKEQDITSLIKYLSSPLFPTIGKRLAENIVKYFKDDVLNKIINNKEELMNISGMTIEKSLILYKNVFELKNNILDFFIENNLSLDIYNKLLRKLNGDTKLFENFLKSDFYSFANKNKIYNFEEIDKISLAFGEQKNSDRRISWVVYNLVNKILFASSNTYTDIDQIKKELYKTTYIDINYPFQSIINNLLYAKENNILYFKDKKIYTKESYEDELYISKKMFEIKNLVPEIKYSDNEITKKINLVELYFREIKKDDTFKFNEEQLHSLKSFVNNNVLIITGGPGTGKTTIITAIIKLYELLYNKKNDDYAILAPTGRAASRIKEDFSDLTTSTIHKFLKYTGEDNFEINIQNQVSKSLLIIDESSILGNHLFSNLLKGISCLNKLVLIGDIKQLPSVDYGNLYEDLINSKLFTTEYLITNNRQSSDNDIPKLANSLWDGNELELNDLKNVIFDYSESQNLLIDKIKFYYEKFNTNNLMESITKVQIISPMYKEEFGINNLNNIIQNHLIKSSKFSLKKGNISFKQNDKIIFTENNAKLSLFNGDVGIIESIYKDKEEYKMRLKFLDRDIIIGKEVLKNIDLSYACSIHKTQGSEYENVIIILDQTNKYTNFFVDKRMLYTAITRAKKNLVILSTKETFMKCSSFLKESRKTTLVDNLLNIFKNKE
ncbi:AAA family ATPase [Spiroplasma turonicum]|uniref:Exodeoxyribonuclease V subunit alpha n=1 Tax=Spiroplasma turonicum TaxID=216946 RepID=A0A0K1P5V2_9MOLU|nr:AAA family ATPase [Spiroplasma turonicum]AKU79635.1 exodeoxyribonuclease V subunit alpha [Spiroplasma turonicum]ALX70656.1 exodeoxyribonuclease V subunit alpha [Spiroplasma turonicum]